MLESRSLPRIWLKIMNSFNCSDHHIQSLSPRYLCLRKVPEGIEGGGGTLQSSPLTPLALHITSFSSTEKTEKKATDKRPREERRKKKIKPQNPIQSKEKETAERKRWGGRGVHALINEPLISTKLITGSWM